MGITIYSELTRLSGKKIPSCLLGNSPVNVLSDVNWGTTIYVKNV